MNKRLETIKLDATNMRLEKTKEGYIRAYPRVTRTGIFLYRKADGSVIRELRPENEVFNEDSLESIFGIPVTNDHPSVGSVNSKNAKELQVGFTGDSVEQDGQFIRIPLTITDQATIDDIESGKREISCGYQCLVSDSNGEGDYDTVQSNIRYNHVAIVRKGRAGSQVRIDGDDAVLVDGDDHKSKQKKEDKMELVSIKLGEKEVQVSKEDSEIISDIYNEIASLKEDNAMLETQKEKASKLAKTLEKKADGLEEELKTFDEKVIAASKERAELVKVADSALEDEVLEKLDSMSTLEIKKAIVESKTEGLKLDEASEEHVNACYLAVSHVKVDKSSDLGDSIVGNREDSVSYSDADTKRQEMIKRQKEAYSAK
jgi:hypothetical protein